MPTTATIYNPGEGKRAHFTNIYIRFCIWKKKKKKDDAKTMVKARPNEIKKG